MYLYRAKTTLKSYNIKKPLHYCNEGDILFMAHDHGEAKIVFGYRGLFPINRHNLIPIKMDANELLKSVIEVSKNIPDHNNFPYTFVTGISNGKDWEPEFLDVLKKSTLKNEVKNRLLKEYEAN